MSRLFVRFGLFEFVSENVWSTTAEAEKRKTFEVIVVAVSLEVISQKPKSQNLKLNNGVHGHKFTFAGWFICTHYKAGKKNNPTFSMVSFKFSFWCRV